MLAVFLLPHCWRQSEGAQKNQEAAGLTTFYNSGADAGNFMQDLDVCSRAVCSWLQANVVAADPKLKPENEMVPFLSVQLFTISLQSVETCPVESL